MTIYVAAGPGNHIPDVHTIAAAEALKIAAQTVAVGKCPLTRKSSKEALWALPDGNTLSHRWEKAHWAPVQKLTVTLCDQESRILSRCIIQEHREIIRDAPESALMADCLNAAEQMMKAVAHTAKQSLCDTDEINALINEASIELSKMCITEMRRAPSICTHTAATPWAESKLHFSFDAKAPQEMIQDFPQILVVAIDDIYPAKNRVNVRLSQYYMDHTISDPKKDPMARLRGAAALERLRKGNL